MALIWSEQEKFQKWLDVELAACKAHVELGNIPEADYEIIREKADFDVTRIKEIEAEINHDVIAFTTSVAEFVGPSSRYVHLGLTSTDVVDTALCLLLQDAGALIKQGMLDFMTALKEKAKETQYVLCMGRTHGVHAEPTTFGLKLAVYYEEMKRNCQRFDKALEDLRVGLISGAVGNYAHIDPRLEQLVCEELGLKPATISTQTLQRDRHAHFVSVLAVIAGTLDKVATEVRALQKTEFNEVQEPFSKAQKGSSAMPHKRNPITCERVTGLARVVRGYAVTAFENQPLWHERDISHSGAERVILPDATTSVDYMLSLMTRVISGLVINESAMSRNIKASHNVFYSQQLLLLLVQKGISREDAYRIVQSDAHHAFDNQQLFDDIVRADERVTSLVSEEELSELFSLDKYKANADLLFSRVFDSK